MFKSVLVTENMARLIYAAVRRGRLRYNYVAACWDSSGAIYVQLAHAQWLLPGQTYVNPHWRR
jgi:hypothetical protein